MGGGGSTRFTWPPVAPGNDDHQPSSPNDSVAQAPFTLDDLLTRPAPGRVARAVREVERVWLGFGARGVGDRLRDTGWAPPPACWRCGGLVGPHETDGEGCAACRTTRVPWDRFVRLGVYEGVLREAVLDLKLSSWRRIGAELGAMMGRRLVIELGRAGVAREEVVLVPIPTTHRRRLSRGVDHTLVLARAAARIAGVPFARALTRAHRPRQTTLSATDRASNVRNTFGYLPDTAGDPGLVVVIDDVRTTGATLRAACRAVGAGGVPRERIWACVAAVSETRRTGGDQGVKIPPPDARERGCRD